MYPEYHFIKGFFLGGMGGGEGVKWLLNWLLFTDLEAPN